jgi:ectoine hydroxylase-related dioxygenase (phytanoyl-CoA dioxygenase family)
VSAPLIDETMLPSAADVAFYREHGYFVSRHVVPDDVIRNALLGIERHFNGQQDEALDEEGFSDWRPGDDPAFRNVEFLALRNVRVRSLALLSVIGAIAAALAGSDETRLWDDQLVWKEPATADDTGAVVGWHTDRAYWHTCTSEQMLTAWIPLHDCPAVMGPLRVVDGSHRWTFTDEMRSFKNKDLQALDPLIDRHDFEDRVRVLELERGQVSFHHCRTIHGSGPNHGSVPRVSLAVHLQDGANRWQEHRNEAGAPWELVNDRLARKGADGTPDYTDPAIFPVLWSRSGRDRD